MPTRANARLCFLSPPSAPPPAPAPARAGPPPSLPTRANAKLCFLQQGHRPSPGLQWPSPGIVWQWISHQAAFAFHTSAACSIWPFCSCYLLWLPDGLPGLLDVPASFADFRASFRFSFCRSFCSLRLPLLCPMRDPRSGPHHLPSMTHDATMAGNAPALVYSPPGYAFRKVCPRGLLSMQNANFDLNGSRERGCGWM